jgi:hypothetical protein
VHNPDSIRNYCYTVHLFGRVYGATQAELHRWSRRRRALSAARECIRLLIPPVRSVVRLAKLAPEKRGVLLRRAPLVLASHWCSTVGRLIGVLHGLDGADVRLLDYDLNACRREAPQRAARTSSTPAGLSSELRSPGSAPR